jgi:hypothetical protein
MNLIFQLCEVEVDGNTGFEAELHSGTMGLIDWTAAKYVACRKGSSQGPLLPC